MGEAPRLLLPKGAVQTRRPEDPHEQRARSVERVRSSQHARGAASGQRTICHCVAVRFGVVLMLSLVGTLPALVAAAPVAAHVPGAYWPVAKTMRSIDGAQVRIGGTVLRLDSETTLCSGLGRPTRRQGVRAWNHFHCTFTTFRRGLPWRDLEFRLHALDARRFAITSPRWIVS